MSASYTCYVRISASQNICVIRVCVCSGSRGGGHELLPAEGGGHGQDQPDQEEDDRVQGQD